MKREIRIITNLRKNYFSGLRIIDKKGITPTLCAAMGMGGGNIPLIMEKKSKDADV